MIGILDDIFPWKGSGFRYAEYDFYLKQSKNISVYSDLSSLGFVGKSDERSEIIASLIKYTNFHAVDAFDEVPRMNGYYCVFLNNVFKVIDLAERDYVPFAFTLYPGGGFELGNADVYEKLRRVISHKLLYKIVVTQPETLRVLEELNCPSSKIEYVFGVVSDVSLVKPSRFQSVRLRKEKNLCFAAHKYDSLGKDKGLDLFIRVADSLVRENRKVNLHMVGPWKSAIAALSEFPQNYHFHDIIPIEELNTFFSKMDIAIFPTRRDVNAPGRFDGFPTATTVQAALAGCVTISTNPLHQVTPLEPNLDYLEVEAEYEDLMRAVNSLMTNQNLVKQISISAKKNFLKNYNMETQMEPRLQLLEAMNRVFM